MATQIWQGRQVREIELLDIFPPAEGEITQYYGRIGQGKTYNATADILDLLRRGNVVYANWRINWSGFDQKKSIPYIVFGILFPWRKRFYNFKRENLRYIPVDEHFHETFEKITDAYVFLDEGHVVFDSYEMAKLSLARRASILHTRHFNRSICIISQRPTAIHVAMRANVNRFYKCEKRWQFGSIIRFRRTEFQDMLNETVDDDEEKALSIKQYWGRGEVFNAYPSKYLRGEIKASQKLEFEAFDFGYFARFALLFKAIFGRKVKLSTALSAKAPERSLQQVEPVVQLEREKDKQNGGADREIAPAMPVEPQKDDELQVGAGIRRHGKRGENKPLSAITDTIKGHVQNIRKTVPKDKKNVHIETGAVVSGDVESAEIISPFKVKVTHLQ
jgi:hypothetical protein